MPATAGADSASAGWVKPLSSPGHQAMGGEGQNLEAGEIERFDVLFVGVLAEMENLGGIGLQGDCDRFELVGGIGQPRQQRELGAVNALRAAASCGA